VEQPSALGYVISVPSGFPEASEDSFIYSLLPIVATLFYVLYCHLVLFCRFTCFCYYVLVYSGFMYRGLAALSFLRQHVNLIRFYNTLHYTVLKTRIIMQDMT